MLCTRCGAYAPDDEDLCDGCVDDDVNEEEDEKTLADMSKDDRSLLIYFETCEVDQGGFIRNPANMNKEDLEKAREWNERKFIDFQRATWMGNLTYRVRLSEKAWELAHEERRARATRMRDSRKLFGGQIVE